MRVCRIEVERLLGFKHLAMDIDANLQVIAGPNNAGKSSLVRTLEAFFSDPADGDLLPLHPLNEYYADLGGRTLSSVMVWFDDLTKSEQKTFGRILRKDGRIWLKVRSSRAGKITFDGSQSPSSDEAKALYGELISQFHFAKIPSVRVGGANDQGEPESLERLLDTLEAILVRRGSARSTALQQEFQAVMTPVEAVVKEVLDKSAAAIMSDLPFREKAVTFRLPESRMALRAMLESAVIESHGAVAVPVSDRGTGFQSALVLGILRYVASREAGNGNVFFAIEEPEAFLHPQTQRAMARIIAKISDDVQVLMTTHSSVLVDSFRIQQIARLPLSVDGLEHEWRQPVLDTTTAGRLTRFCSAANSELVFANAVVFVEGEGDAAVLEHLLSRICDFPGGHYALGVTVIDVGGITTMTHLVELAELLGVRSFVLSDMDGLHNKGGRRKLIDALAKRRSAIDPGDVATLHVEADATCGKELLARKRQKVLNGVLAGYDAFVLTSDLEGLLIDAFGVKFLLGVLGPAGERIIDATFAAAILADPDGGYERLAAWLGSKGWNSDRKSSQKLKTHLPAVIVEAWFAGSNSVPAPLRPLKEWLEQIVAAQEAAAL